jgi:hypothetical protein
MNMDETPICKTYYQLCATLYRDRSTWMLIYLSSFVASKKSNCMVASSKIPNPLLQNYFHYDVDFLVVSSYFVL